MRTAGIPSERWDDVPLFIMPGTHPASTDTTKVFTASQMLPLVRRDAGPAGLPPDEVFGNAYRIGGARACSCIDTLSYISYTGMSEYQRPRCLIMRVACYMPMTGPAMTETALLGASLRSVAPPMRYALPKTSLGGRPAGPASRLTSGII